MVVPKVNTEKGQSEERTQQYQERPILFSPTRSSAKKRPFFVMSERLLSAGTPELVFDNQELDGCACDCRT